MAKITTVDPEITSQRINFKICIF